MMKGSITVFLALSLSVLTGIIVFLTGNAIRNADKVRLEGTVDMAMSSVLGEFHKKLHERYDLLYVDLTHQDRGSIKQKLQNRFSFYMYQNGYLNSGQRPWSGLLISQAEVTDFKTATKENGKSVKKQAVSYKYHCGTESQTVYGCGEGKILLKKDRDAIGEWMSLMGEIQAMELPVIIDEYGQEKQVPLNNPAEAVYEMTDNDVLYMIGIDTSKIGVGAIKTEEYISGRGHEDLQNLISNKKETRIFTEYLFEKMGNYGRTRDDSFLEYQLEYIAVGQRSDYENLKKTIEELLFRRFAVNVTEAFADSNLCMYAQTIAGELYAVQLKEEFLKPVADSIVYAHAYMKSLEEIQTLMQGKTLEGYTYEEYLFCLITELPEQLRNLRSMDIMEMDIRYLTGNSGFSMDKCVEKFTTNTQAVCNLGEKYALTRTYGYY